MDANEYQRKALSTSNVIPGGGMTFSSYDQQLLFLAACLAGEAGEIANYVKKVVGHKHEFNQAELVKEMGDVLWYLGILSMHVGVSLDRVMEENLEKLQRRYPNGFDPQRSIHRFDEELEVEDDPRKD